MVQWLGLLASNAGGMCSILDLGTKIPQAVGCSQKKKKRYLKYMINDDLPRIQVRRDKHLAPKKTRGIEWASYKE